MKSRQTAEYATERITQQMNQMCLLLIYLMLDLGAKDEIVNDYIPKMEDGLAKAFAQDAYKIAKDVLDESLV